MTTARNGGWIERLEAIAAGREVVAVGGVRDAAGVTSSRAHRLTASLEGKGWWFDAGAAVRALAFAGDDLLVTGGDDGRVRVWVQGAPDRRAALSLGAPVRGLAVDLDVARGAAGTIAAVTADGALHVLALSIADGAPGLASHARHGLSDGALHAVAIDPTASGLIICGGADGRLFLVTDAVRAIAPGGDGGIRALACLGDGRAAIGCGDGSLRLCYLVGDAEAVDRSGDHGHDGALRGIALGPAQVDAAGRDLPRRLFTAGEDGAVRSWLVDGARRPKTLELGIGPLTAIAYQHGPVARTEAIGRLWLASSSRQLAAIALGPDTDLLEPIRIGSLLDRLELELRDGKAAVKVKLAAVEALAAIAEDDARALLDLALASGPAEVRVAAAQAMATTGRRQSRPALRAALAAAEPGLRAEAFAALRALDADQPLVAIRAGLAATAEDVRVLAVDALAPLARGSVLAAGLVADALRDRHTTVRRRALAVLLGAAAAPLDAIRTALGRGTPDVRAEALLTLGFVVTAGDGAGAEARDPAARALAAAALDDDDATVRASAFLTAIVQRPRLAARLRGVVPSLQQSFDQLAQQLAAPLALPADDGAPLHDDELEPIFAALACRAPDAAARGAGCLLALGDARAIGAVLQLTREADPAQRRGATANLVAAQARWPDDDRLTARLEWLLDDADAEVRAYAFDALARAAAAATAELALAETALRASREDIRVRALQILVRIGAPGAIAHARADQLLGDALDDEDGKVRAEAFRTLWAWHAADPETPLARGAASRHADLRGQVVAEIERRRQARQATAAMDALVLGLVRDPDEKVGLAGYAALTRQADDAARVALPVDVHLAALGSPVPAVRAAGAAGVAAAARARLLGPGAAPPALRTRLVELVRDDHPNVHLAVIEAIDAAAPLPGMDDAEGFALAFASIFYELVVRAGELCGARRDPRAVAPMQRLLAIPRTQLDRPSDLLRQRAASALADVGAADAIDFLRALVGDDDPRVREMGARGLATACRGGQEPVLVALLGHGDLAVRSWGGEGLARLGDLRALPVLAGTQRHQHRPLRIGAIVGFVALGADGVRGLRQGLEDADRELQDLAFAVIVARDVALADAGIAPDLLVDAMASPGAEIRFAAARLFERRAAGEAIAADVVAELVGPRRPDKAADAKDWPAPPRRAALLRVLADAIASDEPGQRYAAAQVLAVRAQPLTFWREAERLAGPIGGPAARAPRTGWTPEARTTRRAGWLRRLVANRRDPEATGLEVLARLFARTGAPTPAEAAAGQRLVFGVYAGLIRQAPARGAADETHRVRRDAVARLVELAREDAIGAEAVLPVLAHAVSDPHHLVRQAAMAALRSLHPTGALAPLAIAIGAAADLGKPAIDELVERAGEGDARAAALVRQALDADDAAVRAHAAIRLPRLYPAASAEPHLVAAASKHADVRLAAIAQLAAEATPTAAVSSALVAALASEHADLRLRAAVALARRGDPLGIDVLGGFLRDEEHAEEALEALIALADHERAGAAAEAIAARLDDDPDRTADRDALFAALAALHHPAGAPALVRVVTAVATGTDQETEARAHVDDVLAALDAIWRDRGARPQALPDGRTRARLREAIALRDLGALAASPLVEVRLGAAARLGDVDDRAAEDVLAKLLGDRDAGVRVAAAEALAVRAEHAPGASLAPLEAALRGGRRELVLPAALGLAARRRPEAFQPLLLVAKAGEPAEQARAVVALGALGDRRALEHLLPLLDPAPDDAVARALTPAAAEALGRLVPALDGDDATELRARLERLALTGAGEVRLRALTGLRHAGAIGLAERVAADREEAEDVRAHATTELGLSGALTVEASLADLLADRSPRVRAAAAAALAKLLHGDRTRVSLHALRSPFDDVSAPAARFLAASGDPATLVERIGGVKTAELRALLREGLVRRGELPVAAVEAALRGDDPRARTEAAWLAGYAGARGRDVAAAVAAAAARGDRGWRAATADAGARDDEARAWAAALWAARRVGAEVAAPVVGAALGDVRAPAPVRRAAAALAPAGALAAHLGDLDREVRAIAAATLAATAPADAPVRALGARADATTIAPLALAVWTDLAAPALADAGARSWALVVGVAGRRVAELVAIASAPGDEAARLAAIGALGRLGGGGAGDLGGLGGEPAKTAQAALERIHADEREPDAVRLAAWKALRRLTRPTRTYPDGQDKGPRGGRRGGDGDEGEDAEDQDDGDGDSDEADAERDEADDADDEALEDEDGDDDDDDDSDDDSDDDDDSDEDDE